MVVPLWFSKFEVCGKTIEWQFTATRCFQKYQHYVFGNFGMSPKISSVGIVTLNAFSSCLNLLNP